MPEELTYCFNKFILIVVILVNSLKSLELLIRFQNVKTLNGPTKYTF